jgi:hypothetical protein
MFGRFGGGGNFVAQYRCYPVSFIDRVRAPACPSARDAFNQYATRRPNAASGADPRALRQSRTPPPPQPQLENGDKGAPRPPRSEPRVSESLREDSPRPLRGHRAISPRSEPSAVPRAFLSLSPFDAAATRVFVIVFVE